MPLIYKPFAMELRMSEKCIQIIANRSIPIEIPEPISIPAPISEPISIPEPIPIPEQPAFLEKV